MQGKHLFEYSIIRYVPKVERGEAINLGIIMFCKELNFLKLKYKLDRERLLAFHCDADIENLELHLRSFQLVSEGDETALGIASLEQTFRFRWLASKRSTILQTSEIHPGFCKIRTKCLFIYLKNWWIVNATN